MKIKLYFSILTVLLFFISAPAFAALEYTEYISQTTGGCGYHVRSTAYPSGRNFVGQTFTTPSNCKYIDYIQLYLDSNQWTSDERLTLTLYDSISKTNKISQFSLNGSNGGHYPKFYLKTSISPNTAYYMELSHEGGGDEWVGWVVASPSSSYSDGDAYQGNTTLSQLPGDLYFKVWGYENDFLITAYYLPPPTLTTEAQYNLLANANFNRVQINRTENRNEQQNDDILDLCSTRGVLVINNDDSFADTTGMTEAEIDTAVARYKDNDANGGFFIQDEPTASEFADCANVYKRILVTAPTKLPHVNLNPMFSGKTSLEVPAIESVVQTSTGTGYFVRSAAYASGRNCVGQTFITPSDCSYIEYVELNIDRNQWSSTENLILTLYTSIDRTTKVSQVRLNGSNALNFPKFYLETGVSPNTEYYMELSHIGYGDNTVGWVTATTSDSYLDGSAYQGNATLTQLAGDLYFKIYRGRSAKDQSLQQTVSGSGLYVSSNQSLGQTFTTPANLERRLKFIELYLDPNTWGCNENLTMTVYDSPAKNSILDSVTIKNPSMLLLSQETGGAGYHVRSDAHPLGKVRVGQTFVTPADCTDIDFVQLWIDSNYWSVDECLTLTLYDSPARTTMIGQASLNGSNFWSYPKFYLGASVSPNTSYYLELCHDGGGDEQVGWVCKSVDDTYNDGTVYVNGTAYTGDLYFKIYSQLHALSGIYPRFDLNANLRPDTTYFWELTHDGGGDNQVGWICRSVGDTYSGGVAYVNGSVSTGDFCFRAVFRNFYEDYLNEWVEAVGADNLKYLSFDHYPFLVDTELVSDYFLNLELVRNIGLQNNVKIASYIQSVGIENSLRIPNENELRFNVYTNLAYGVKQIQWFTYFTPVSQSTSFDDAIVKVDGTTSSIYTSVQTLNGEVEKLGPTLVTLRSQDVFHSGERASGTQSLPTDYWWRSTNPNDNIIISYFKNHDGRKYVMVVNCELETGRTYYFDISPSPTTITQVSKSTGYEISTNYSSGSLSDYFYPGEGKLYVLPVGY